MTTINIENYKNKSPVNKPKHTFDRFIVNVLDNFDIVGSFVFNPEYNWDLDDFLVSIADSIKVGDEKIKSVELISSIDELARYDSSDNETEYHETYIIKGSSLTLRADKKTRTIVKVKEGVNIHFMLIDGFDAFQAQQDEYERQESLLKTAFRKDVKEAYKLNNKIFDYITRNIPKNTNRNFFMQSVLKEVQAYQDVFAVS